MTQIDWKASYSVGVRELDQQHRRILEIINDFAQIGDRAGQEKEIYGTLNALVKYAQSHFKAEERLMSKHHYEGLDRQKEEHAAFTAQVFEFNRKLAAHNPTVYHQIVNYLQQWFIDHILGLDKNYKDHFNRLGLD